MPHENRALPFTPYDVDLSLIGTFYFAASHLDRHQIKMLINATIFQLISIDI